MGQRDTAVIEATMLHLFCAIMARERQLHALALSHPYIDRAYFDDLRSGLINCTREFGRICGPSLTHLEIDAVIEQMAA